ncbi:hypothetical protein BU17DRAFT_101907 [Hysterangium stoloniferum]|nr:hypothetical protein BU17DRAFT_101907 [Hysterangium stoloniferum]
MFGIIILWFQEELVRRFSKLQDLEYLGWDYSSFLTDLTSVHETRNEEDDLRMTDGAIVPIMALPCARLQVMEYFYTEFSHAFSIKRDDEGASTMLIGGVLELLFMVPLFKLRFGCNVFRASRIYELICDRIASARLIMPGIPH